MKRLFGAALAACAFLISPNVMSNELAPYCSEIKASGNAEYPPYLWRDAEDPSNLTGAIRFLIDDISNELNIPIDLRYHGPWGRVQAKTAEGRVDMITGAFFTTPRTEYMDYIYPEFQGTKTAVWVNSSKPFSFEGWDDLKPHRGITVVNNSFGEKFDEYKKEHLTIDEVGSLNQGLGMLSLGRVDYLIYEENPGLATMRKNNIQGVETLPTAVTSQPLYLTVSKRSACNTDALKDAIKALLVRFSEEKRMEGHLQRALELWKQQAGEVAGGK